MRLIDADVLRKRIEEWIQEEESNYYRDIENATTSYVLDNVLDYIDTTPTAALETDAQRWRNPETDPPKVETEVLVLVDCGKGYCITTAFYEDGTVSQYESAWQWEDVDDYGIYDEEEDLYRLAKGWWEYRHFTPDDALECPIDKPVVGWMPLPPKEVKQ